MPGVISIYSDLRQTQSGLNSTRRAQRDRRGAAAGFISPYSHAAHRSGICDMPARQGRRLSNLVHNTKKELKK